MTTIGSMLYGKFVGKVFSAEKNRAMGFEPSEEEVAATPLWVEDGIEVHVDFDKEEALLIGDVHGPWAVRVKLEDMFNWEES